MSRIDIEYRIENRGRMVIGTYAGKSIGVKLDRAALRNSSIHNREIKLAKQRIAAQIAGRRLQTEKLYDALFIG